MRRFRRVPPWLLVLAVVALVSGACASTPPDRVALSLLQATKATADAAMRTANDLFVAGKITPETVMKLIVDYDAYIAANVVATQALRAYVLSGAPVTQAAMDQITGPALAAAKKVTR